MKKSKKSGIFSWSHENIFWRNTVHSNPRRTADRDDFSSLRQNPNETSYQEAYRIVMEAHRRFLMGLPDGVQLSFAGRELTQVDARGAILKDWDLSSAKIQGGDFRHTAITNPGFQSTAITGANPDEVTLYDPVPSRIFRRPNTDPLDFN